jgi:DNA-binding response OmpR family regulator
MQDSKQLSCQVRAVEGLLRQAERLGLVVPPNCQPTEQGLMLGGSLIPWPIDWPDLLRTLDQQPPELSPELPNGYQFDPTKLQVHGHDQQLHLTEREAGLLSQLLRSNDGLPREQALSTWVQPHRGYGDGLDSKSFESHLYRLRQKLLGLNPPLQIVLNEDGCYLVIPA